MAPHLVEEAFEAADALRRGITDESRAELGDVLVNVTMISQIASEAGQYTADDVAQAAAEKLIRRHPHVFGDQQADSAEIAFKTWEAQKQLEKEAAGEDLSVLSGVPKAMPALLRAYRVGEKASKVGFDWPDQKGPRAKLSEEVAELDEAVQSGDKAAIADELGDVLFSVCNLARHLGINPEVALASTTDKFHRRFNRVEQAFDYQLQGKPLADMEAAWDQAKRDGL
ncbi:MAG: MazG family protein [Planctomycetota bacterium]|jgi:MazG family protein